MSRKLRGSRVMFSAAVPRVAGRVILEITRSRRTLALFLLAPIVIMTLIYFALLQDEVAEIGVVSRGAARLFDGEFVAAIDRHADARVVPVSIPDSETDPEKISEGIRRVLESGEADGVLQLDGRLLEDRFEGRQGDVRIHVEGSRPLMTATVLSAVSESVDELAEALPVVIAPDCSSHCAESVNNLAMNLEEVYLHGSKDDRTIDFFLPVFPPFFVFFFTFIISMIEFQRERTRGTLDRILIAPVSFGHVILGYVLGFLLFAAVQAAIVLAYIFKLIRAEFSPLQMVSVGVVILLVMLVALMMGLLASYYAANEFQAIQFVPLVVLPQVFLSDLVWNVEGFPKFFQVLAHLMPLTYANRAVRDVLIRNRPLAAEWQELGVLLLFLIVSYFLLILVGRRKAV